jgi:indolepyruvate ferredoxin oxidoreductase
MKGFQDWAEGLDLIVVVEEKRKLIEVQIKEAIFDDRRGRRVYGWTRAGAGRRRELFPTRMALDPVMIAEKIGGILIEEGRGTDRIKAGCKPRLMRRARRQRREIAARTALFLLGLPAQHLDQGARGQPRLCRDRLSLHGAMDGPRHLGFTHMGGEGANWIGEAPFSTREHVFQNLGDGTYNHSGVQAIRALIAGGHQHHLQDPLQRRRRDDRRAGQRGRADPDRSRASCRRWACERSRGL